jgi:hypothetical protein
MIHERASRVLYTSDWRDALWVMKFWQFLCAFLAARVSFSGETPTYFDLCCVAIASLSGVGPLKVTSRFVRCLHVLGSQYLSWSKVLCCSNSVNTTFLQFSSNEIDGFSVCSKKIPGSLVFEGIMYIIIFFYLLHFHVGGIRSERGYSRSWLSKIKIGGILLLWSIVILGYGFWCRVFFLSLVGDCGIVVIEGIHFRLCVSDNLCAHC